MSQLKLDGGGVSREGAERSDDRAVLLGFVRWYLRYIGRAREEPLALRDCYTFMAIASCQMARDVLSTRAWQEFLALTDERRRS